MTRVWILALALFLAFPVYAQERHSARRLTTQEIERIKEFKLLVGDVDKKSLAQTINELEKTPYPQVNLKVREAMARAYTDIVRDQDVKGQQKKEWLYSMVSLNMAYLQFEGVNGKAGKTEPLNKLIRMKLKEYLPADVVNHPGFRCSLG